jgi:3-hydroxybutyryl-CoA dehydratase
MSASLLNSSPVRDRKLIQARHRQWQELAEESSAEFSFTIEPEDMTLFAQLSGDENPLHTDSDYARAKGFADRVVYGGILVAKISGMLGMELPGRTGIWAGLKLNFRNPLYVGEPATFTALVSHRSEAAHMVQIDIEIKAGDRMIATGKSESVVMEDDYGITNDE